MTHDNRFETVKMLLKRLFINLLYFFLFFQTASSSGDPHVHIIKMVKPEDEGLYTCIAGNFLGQAEASAYLEVNSANTKFSHSTPMTLAAAAALIFTLFTQVCSKTLPFASRRVERKTVD